MEKSQDKLFDSSSLIYISIIFDTFDYRINFIFSFLPLLNKFRRMDDFLSDVTDDMIERIYPMTLERLRKMRDFLRQEH